MARPLITLTTDFGEGSSYIAQMKGVILSLNPDAQVVDLSHSVHPQDVRQGALVLADVTQHFPREAIHVAVVDPGVGSNRELLCAKCGSLFLAPDNGLLTMVAQNHAPEAIFAIKEPRYWRAAVSRTFHGRDILAPVAAHLSLGVPPRELGPRRDQLMRLAIPSATREGNRISGTVISVDSFGNLITNVLASQLPGGSSQSLRIHCHHHQIAGLTATYAKSPPGTLVALIGSTSRLEIAVVNGNAATQLQLGVTTPVVIEW